jgi:flagellin
MPIVVNTNAAASTAAFNLSKNHANLSKSLARLSSGNRIVQPAEDAGGLAVAYKLDSSMKRTEALLNNHQNALSYLQVQDGALESVGNIVSRMAELRTMAADVTKNSGDIENYSKEFRELQQQLNQIKLEKFNGIDLFRDESTNATGANAVEEKYAFENGNQVSFNKSSFTLLTHPSGESADGNISINVVNLQHVLTFDDNDEVGGTGAGRNSASIANIGGFNLKDGTAIDNTKISDANYVSIGGNGYINSITAVGVDEFTNIIQKIADARAENGAEQMRVQQSYEFHQTNLVNLEAAHGRIMDVDVALESTRFAKHNVLVQASASMTAQANQLTQVALTLLQ